MGGPEAPARPGPGGQFLLRLLPFLIMAIVAAVDLLAGPRVGFLPLLSLGPALAAVVFRPAHTALVGGLALLLCVPLAFYDHVAGERPDIIALTTIAGITLTGSVASAARHRRERELADVTAVAEAAQRVLLRPVPPQVGPVEVAVRFVSANASARIGGDLYDVITTGGRVRLVIGDAQGKGLPAVQTAALVLGAFREAAPDAPDLRAIAARIELSLRRRAAGEEFVTAILAELSADGSSVEILNCGHPPPLLVSGAGTRPVGWPDGELPFGLSDLADPERRAHRIALAPGEQLLFYTDGISEARNRSGAFYRLGDCGGLLTGSDPQAALDRLCADVIGHVGHRLLDDAAMLLVRRPAPRPGQGQADGSPGGQGFGEAPASQQTTGPRPARNGQGRPLAGRPSGRPRATRFTGLLAAG